MTAEEAVAYGMIDKVLINEKNKIMAKQQKGCSFADALNLKLVF